jgi:hypothetical protein
MKRKFTCFLLTALLCLFGNTLVSFASEEEIVPIEFESNLISKMATPCWSWQDLGRWMLTEMPNEHDEWTEFRSGLENLLSNETAKSKDFYFLLVHKMPSHTEAWKTFLEHVEFVSVGTGEECETLWTAATVVNANGSPEGQEDVEQFESVLMDRMAASNTHWKQLANWLMIYMPENTSEEWAMFRSKLQVRIDHFSEDANSFYAFVVNSVPLNSERWLEFKKKATQFFATVQEDAGLKGCETESRKYSLSTINKECQKVKTHLFELAGKSVVNFKSWYDWMIHYWTSGQTPPVDPENPPQVDSPRIIPVPSGSTPQSNQRNSFLQSPEQHPYIGVSGNEIEVVIKSL